MDVSAVLGVGTPKAPAILHPPEYFTPVVGLRSARRTEGTTTRLSGSPTQKAGIRYERKVEKLLRREYGDKLDWHPWFAYVDDRGRSRCQPDGILIFDGYCVVLEAKVSHCMAAWFQLRQKYEMVVEKAIGLPAFCLEVCKSYDPAVGFPEPIEYLDDWFEFQKWLSQPSKLGVLQWRL